MVLTTWSSSALMIWICDCWMTTNRLPSNQVWSKIFCSGKFVKAGRTLYKQGHMSTCQGGLPDPEKRNHPCADVGTQAFWWNWQHPSPRRHLKETSPLACRICMRRNILGPEAVTWTEELRNYIIWVFWPGLNPGTNLQVETQAPFVCSQFLAWPLSQAMCLGTATHSSPPMIRRTWRFSGWDGKHRRSTLPGNLHLQRIFSASSRVVSKGSCDPSCNCSNVDAILQQVGRKHHVLKSKTQDKKAL